MAAQSALADVAQVLQQTNKGLLPIGIYELDAEAVDITENPLWYRSSSWDKQRSLHAHCADGDPAAARSVLLIITPVE